MKKPTSFDEAFNILDRAIADQDAPNLRPLVKDEIRFLMATADAESTEVVKELSRGQTELNALVRELTSLGSEQMKVRATELVDRVRVHARENPLLYLAGAAAGVVALGFIAGHLSSREASASRAVVHMGTDNSFDESLLQPQSGLKSDSGVYS